MQEERGSVSRHTPLLCQSSGCRGGSSCPGCHGLCGRNCSGWERRRGVCSAEGICTRGMDRELLKSTLRSTSDSTFLSSPDISPPPGALCPSSCFSVFLHPTLCAHSALPCRNLPVAGHTLGLLGVWWSRGADQKKTTRKT